MVRRPAHVELTGVRHNCLDDTGSRVPTISSGRMFEDDCYGGNNNNNRDQIIKSNVFGHRWVLRINENERQAIKRRSRWKKMLYVLVFGCIVLALCFGIFFSVESNTADHSSSSSNNSYAIAALPPIASETADATTKDNLVRAQLDPSSSKDDAIGIYPPTPPPPPTTTTYFNPFLYTTAPPPTQIPPHLLYSRSPPPRHYHQNPETTTFPAHLLFTTRAPPWTLTSRSPLDWLTTPANPYLYWMTTPSPPPLQWSTAPPQYRWTPGTTKLPQLWPLPPENGPTKRPPPPLWTPPTLPQPYVASSTEPPPPPPPERSSPRPPPPPEYDEESSEEEEDEPDISIEYPDDDEEDDEDVEETRSGNDDEDVEEESEEDDDNYRTSSNSKIHPGRHICVDCQENGEICIKEEENDVPRCLKPRDTKDPTGCGGLCQVNLQYCKLLDADLLLYQCMETNNQLKCPPNKFNCGNMCIPHSKRCDGFIHCSNNSDEENCECDLETHFRCGNETACLDNSRKCDGNIDCWDKSDEDGCNRDCNEDQLPCQNGQCIKIKQFCDGNYDCYDKSDEPWGCSK